MENQHSTLTSLFTDVANAIRGTSSITESMKADNFPAYIYARNRSDCPARPSVLNDCPWSFIRWASDNGYADLFWSIGDRKAITLSGRVGNTVSLSGSYYCCIVGINHNSAVEGDNRIHFELGFDANGKHIAFVEDAYNLYYTNTSVRYYIRMNPSATNAGGWASCTMRTDTLNGNTQSMKNVLPSDLKSVLKTVTKYTDNVGQGKGSVAASITATTDTLFLMNVQELRGTGTCNTYERDKTVQYQYYKNGNPKKRGKHNAPDTLIIIWLRSVNPSNSRFLGLNASEGGYIQDANFNFGISPCFCV